MKNKKNGNLNRIFNSGNLLLLAIVLVLVGISFFAGQSGQKTGTDFAMRDNGVSELSTNGFVAVKPEAGVVNGDGVISLTGNCYRVVAGTEPHLAESIANGIEKRIVERPNTHDILRDQLESFDIKILMIKVVDIRKNNFIGKIILKQDDKIVSLESRPSDGIALAVRTNSSVYMNETLMKKYGEKVC